MNSVTTSCIPSRPEHDIKVDGEIDLSSQPDLVSAIRMFMKCVHSSVCIDAETLDFVDSTGLTFLAHLARLAHERGGQVRVTGAPRQLSRLIEVTALPIEVDQTMEAPCAVTAASQP